MRSPFSSSRLRDRVRQAASFVESRVAQFSELERADAYTASLTNCKLLRQPSSRLGGCQSLHKLWEECRQRAPTRMFYVARTADTAENVTTESQHLLHLADLEFTLPDNDPDATATGRKCAFRHMCSDSVWSGMYSFPQIQRSGARASMSDTLLLELEVFLLP